MWHYKHSFTVKASLEKVTKFHQDSRALKKLTPPPMIVQIHKVEPLAENSVAEFTMWLGPLPVRWVARHQEVNPEKGFIDIQEKGPFQNWIHKHEFRSIQDGRVQINDSISASPGKGIYRRLISTLMWIGLPILFSYRGWATRRAVS